MEISLFLSDPLTAHEPVQAVAQASSPASSPGVPPGVRAGSGTLPQLAAGTDCGTQFMESTGDRVVPRGDSPRGMALRPGIIADARFQSDARLRSVLPLAGRHGRVARATHAGF